MNQKQNKENENKKNESKVLDTILLNKKFHTVRAVFSDIDGTLLNSQHVVTPKTRTSIQKLREQDILFTLSSSRSPAGIEPIAEKNQFQCCIIAFGGALILNENRRILYEMGMNKMTAGKVIDFIENKCPDVIWNIYTADMWMVKNKNDSRVQHEEQVVETYADEGTIEDLTDDACVDKILCMCAPGQIDSVEALVCTAFPELSVAKSSDTLLEIMQKGVNKADAVKRLCQIKRIDMEDTMAFGDNYNDLEMLEAVQFGIAMENAPLEIRQRVRFVTSDNNHDGIANILEKI